jgi:hypothetical protein
MNMGKVSTGLTMSLNGCIAGPNDGPRPPLADGGERLFAWYSSGDTDYRLPGTEMVFKVSPASAERSTGRPPRRNERLRNRRWVANGD